MEENETRDKGLYMDASVFQKFWAIHINNLEDLLQKIWITEKVNLIELSHMSTSQRE